MCRVAFASLVLIVSMIRAEDPPRYPAPKTLGEVSTYGKHIQRTMRLLATSSTRLQHRVKILFYGQSITEQNWWKLVADDLRKRFPHADLVIENRAIGGFASQLLVRMAETDLYTFQPDLVIFHVYGSHIEYENIIRRLRERTTAEILLQSDHATKPEDLTEEKDPQKLTPKQWSAWMNHSFLPGTARKYGAEFVEQHELWKTYLRDHHLAPQQLLRDGVHLNVQGCYLMAEIAKAYLRYDPSLIEKPVADSWVKTIPVQGSLTWKDGVLDIPFEGNRIDLLFSTAPATVEVTIDGVKPSTIPGLVASTRTTSYPGSNWPCLLKNTWQAAPIAEEWTLTFTGPGNGKDYTDLPFTVTGSITGADGNGTTKSRFVSHSHRLVIEPDDWNLEYARKVFGSKLPVDYTVRWKRYALGVDEVSTPASAAANRENAITVAQQLANTRHVLRLKMKQGEASSVLAARVYQPPLGRK